MFETLNQIWIFLSCVFLGGCIFLLYKIFHLYPPSKKWLTAIADVGFSCAAFVVVCIGLLYICCGSLRWYCFAGIALGFFLCKKSLGDCIDIFILRLYNLFTKIKNKRVKDEPSDQDRP